MGRLSRSILCFGLMLCFGAALAVATNAYARGGTYHRSDPYAVHPYRHKTHSWAPVIVYSPEHGHYHLTYHPR